MKKLVFIFAAITVLAFAACTETKAPEAPVEEAVEAVNENEADLMTVEDAAEAVGEAPGDTPTKAAKGAANEGVRDDISVKR
ncbi:MAG: hypothetical protein IJM04_04865 [Prevotella sp.]|nr:hypothetical protein [Prevotella sp.]